MNLEIHYTPPNQSRQVVPVRDRLMIGSLLSNEVVIRASGVEPIHAMIEVLENGIHILTDLGSQSGVFLNGQKVDVETPLKIGDKITIGNVQIDVFQHQVIAAPVAAPYLPDMSRTQVGDVSSPMKKTSVASSAPRHAPSDDDDDHDDDDSAHDGRSTVLMGGRSEENAEVLFSPKNAKPSSSSGNVLECVAYWDDTILDVDMFHPKIKNNERVTIGTPDKAHFLAGGTEEIKRYKLASVSREGYSIHLRSDMTARTIKGGRVTDESGDKSLELGKNDIVHVTHGAVKYFFMFIKPPVLELPRNNARDPFFMAIMIASTLFYLASIPLIYMTKPTVKDNQDDIWAIVDSLDKKELPKPPEKKKVEIAEVKKEPPPPVEPPKPPPKPPTPVKPEEKPKPVEKVVQPKPVEKPVVKELAKPTPVTPKPPTPKAADSAKAGMVKLADKPDMKNPGKVQANKPQGPSGGALGGGKPNQAAGGARKGNTSNDIKGVEGGKPDVASGVNLSKLGAGVGLILDKNAAGAVKTDFKSSSGGVGGGSGSAAKTTGLGGPGAGKSLGVSGAGGPGNNFGGLGGNGSGGGGAGGLGGAGLGNSFGKGTAGKGGRADVSVPPGDPVVSGGLTNQEVQAVIRANLNQIRHCYETLLQRSPNANGKIKVNFTIAASGSVSATSINSDTIGDSAMAGCVTGKIQRWKFPNPRGGQQVQVTYPFVFNPM